jgi:hypothetical protein
MFEFEPQLKAATVLSRWAMIRLDTPVKVYSQFYTEFMKKLLWGLKCWPVQRAADRWMFKVLKRGLGQVIYFSCFSDPIDFEC